MDALDQAIEEFNGRQAHAWSIEAASDLENARFNEQVSYHLPQRVIADKMPTIKKWG